MKPEVLVIITLLFGFIFLMFFIITHPTNKPSSSSPKNKSLKSKSKKW